MNEPEARHASQIAPPPMAAVRLVGTMKERRGVQAVILGGTELPLILTDPAAAAVPLLDTTTIHVNAAVQQLWALG